SEGRRCRVAGVSRRLVLLAILGCALLLSLPAAASATVVANGNGNEVELTSDGDGDTLTLTCAGGQTPPGGLVEIPCDDVETIYVSAGAGNDTINLSNVSRAIFPNLGRVDILPGEGEDQVFGTQIGDEIYADGEDVVSGGAGND